MELTRNYIGYANHPPQAPWPGGAALAINFVINYEEGSEYSIDDGDGHSEKSLIEVSAPRVPPGKRDLAAESMYEYGSRVGFWRLHRLFSERKLPVTIFAAAVALERNRAVADAIAAASWDVVAHGYRWIEHYMLDEATERDHIAKAFDTIKQAVGYPPTGWYCRYSRSVNTRRLVVEHGGYAYDSDAYNDEVPYWTAVGGKQHLVLPYSMVTNDAKILAGGGIQDPADYARFLIESVEVLLAEGRRTPRMMSVGLHPRVIGHPGRFAGLVKFIDHVSSRDGVWIARRIDIADHWRSVMPPAEAQ